MPSLRSSALGLFAAALVACAPEVQVAPLSPPPPLPPPPPPPVVVKPAPITIVERIEFEAGNPFVRDEDRALLDRIVETLKQRPNVKLVEVCGHTDDGGELDPNLVLSQQRAETVRGYLVSKGIDAARLRTRAYGKTIPIVPNDTPANRAHNRRVDFRILEQ